MKSLTSTEAARQILFADGPEPGTGYDERDVQEVAAIIDRVDSRGVTVMLAILSFLVGLMACMLLTAVPVVLVKWQRFVLGGTVCLAWFASITFLRDLFGRRPA
jgi:hypothetical protein